MRPMGVSSFRGSYWASYSLTWTAARDCALFLLPQTEQGQKEEENVDDHEDAVFDLEYFAQDNLADYKILGQAHVGKHQGPLQVVLGIVQREEGAESGGCQWFDQKRKFSW